MKILPKLLFLGTVIFAMISQWCPAQNRGVPELAKIDDLIQSATVNEEAIIESIAQELDLLVDSQHPKAIETSQGLLEFAKFIRYRPDLDKDPSIVGELKEQRRTALMPYAEIPFTPDLKGRQLLYYAAGMMGIPIDQLALLRFAKNSTSIAFRYQALSAVTNQERIMPEAEQLLIALSKDDYHYTDNTCAVPPFTGDTPQKIIYPIRDRALEALAKLKENTSGVPATLKTQEQIHAPEVKPQSGASDELPPHLEPAPEKVSSNRFPNDHDSLAQKMTLVWVPIILAAIGLLWIMFKRRTEP